jgi:hypothetical protein
MGAANGPALPLGDPAHLRINEWLTDGQRINENDFIEVFNPQGAPVALGGLYFTDTIDGGRDRDRITPLTFIAANGFQVFFADDDEGAGADHLNFNLDSIHEPIAVYDSELDLIDMVISGPQKTDVSQGLSPDGSDTHAYFGLPTPGFSNVDNPAVVALINGLRFTEIMYHPLGTSADEFVELQNVSSLPLDVSNVRIRGGISYTFPSRVLAPGEVVVLVNDTAAFEDIYGTNIHVLGEFTGNLSNGGEEIELKVPLPLEVDIQRFSYNDNPDNGWPVTPDGTGPSLVVIDTEGNYNDGSNWRPSVVNGGTPGVISASLSGDFDLDGDLDLDDIEGLHAVIVAGNNNQAYDVTDDGQVTFEDLVEWVENLKGTLMADANLDGFVDGSDFNRWNDHKFTFAAGWFAGDFNANGAVDASDFNFWTSNRFRAPAALAPEARTPRAASAEQLSTRVTEVAMMNVTADSTDSFRRQRSARPLDLRGEHSVDSSGDVSLTGRRKMVESMRRRRIAVATRSAEPREFAQLADNYFADLAEDPRIQASAAL